MLVAAAAEFARHEVVAEVAATGALLGSYASQLSEAGYALHHLPFSKSPKFFFGLMRLLRRRYDVVHIHTERANFWLALTALLARAPVVVRTIHSVFSFSGRLELRRRLQRRLLVRLGVQQVAVGKSVQEEEERRIGRRLERIPNWYDSDRFVPPTPSQRCEAREALGITDEEVVITSVGNCAPVKNHDLVLRALAHMAPERRPLYIHVGIEEEGQRERALAARFGLGDRVRFLGRLEDPRQALYASDGFVMPSLYEGFGIAAIEALAVGLPLVLTNVPGLRDLRETFASIIFADPQVDSMASAIGTFASLTHSERRAIGEANSATAKSRFGVRQGVRSYVQLYRNGHGADPV
jgi:glycosyltransferase involved in cell wall biosynthesis